MEATSLDLSGAVCWKAAKLQHRGSGKQRCNTRDLRPKSTLLPSGHLTAVQAVSQLSCKAIELLHSHAVSQLSCLHEIRSPPSPHPKSW